MKQCYGYTRVSTVKQGDGVSLEVQRDAIKGFAAHRGIIITKWFEETETAAKRGRPVFNQMVAELRRRRAAGVIFHKIDRSARNFADWARIGDLSEAGFDVHFSNENLDFSSRGGRLTADIQAVIAADYIRNLREESIKGQNGRLKQGLYPYKAPIGYLNNGGGKPKTIDPVRAPLIKNMYELYATGNYSLWSLVPKMKELGLRNHHGKPLAKTAIEKILRNPFYTGIITIKRTKCSYTGIHEPLISVPLYEVVCRIREARDNKKETKHNHLYRGMFKCGNCEVSLIPERQKGHVYYRCHKKNCDTKTIREDALESNIVQLLQRVSLSDYQLLTIKKRFANWLDKQEAKTITEIAPMELATIETRLSSLTDKFIDEKIDEDIYQQKKTELLLEQQKWQQVLTEKSSTNRQKQRLDQFICKIRNLATHYQAAADMQKRELVFFATSNRKMKGKNLTIEPSNWYQYLHDILGFDDSDPSRATNRTFEELSSMLNEKWNSSSLSLFID